jgi:NAD(P)H-flavin reductase
MTSVPQAAPPMDPRLVPVPHRVVLVRRDTADTVTIGLAPLAGRPAPFAPGQVDMLYAFGVGEVPISISGDALLPAHREYTIRRVGAVTRALTDVAVGDQLGVRGPFGRPWPLDEARHCDVVIVAGGIGLAPLRAAVLWLLDHRDDYGAITVLYGARAPGDILYRSELEQWGGRFDTDVDVTVDAARAGWHGNVGVVTRLIPRARFESGRTTAFVCGPEIMMRFAAEALLDRGVPPERVHVSCERNMLCGLGTCGHCQVGPFFACVDGPVLAWDEVAPFLRIREL